MNLDDLVDSISESDLKAQLRHWVESWKTDDSDVGELSEIIDRWHGSVWFSDQRAQNKFYERFQKFRNEAIQGIGGMTLNERLYWFGLFEYWDSSGDESRGRLRAKLRAAL